MSVKAEFAFSIVTTNHILKTCTELIRMDRFTQILQKGDRDKQREVLSIQKHITVNKEKRSQTFQT